MINVNQITSTLAKLPDQALQQYAAMHKNDPYIMALAVAESNRRKEMRSEAQGMQGQMPQPKVADQAIAGMAERGIPSGDVLPEMQGIGRLPAGDMDFADGGIVAFGNGGDVERYQSKGLVQIPGPDFTVPGMVGGSLGTDSGAFTANEARALYDAAMQKLQSYGVRQRQMDPTGYQAAVDAANSARTALESAQRVTQSWNAQREASQRNPAEGPAGVLRQNMVPNAQTPPEDAVDRLSPGDMALRRQPIAVDGQKPAAPKVDTEEKSALSANTAGAQAQANPLMPPRLYDLATTPAQMKEAMRGMGIASGVPTEITSGIEKLRNAQQALADRNVEQIQAEQAARGQAFAGLEQRLKEREGRVGKLEADNAPMAMLQAGLAIMGGTSRHALTNIGLGAQVGVKAYAEGLDKLERAREKLDDSFARIEEVRRNESRMDSKELREAKNAAMQPAIEAQKLGLSALEKNWGLDRQDATKGLELLFKNRQTIIEQQGQDRRASAQINAIPTDVRTYEALGAAQPGSALRTGFDLAKTAALRERAIETWSKLAYPAGGMPNEAFLRRYPDAQSYAEEMLLQNTTPPGAGAAGANPPVVRTR